MTWYKRDFRIIKTAYNPLYSTQIKFNKKPSTATLVSISFEGVSSRTYSRIPPPLLFLSYLYSSENPWMKNCPTGNDETNFVSEIISMSILLFVIFTKESSFLQNLYSSEHQLIYWYFKSKWFQNLFGSELLTVPDGSSHS